MNAPFSHFLILPDISLANLMQIINKFFFGYNIPWIYSANYECLYHKQVSQNMLQRRYFVFYNYDNIEHFVQATNIYKKIFYTMYSILIIISQSKV